MTIDQDQTASSMEVVKLALELEKPDRLHVVWRLVPTLNSSDLNKLLLFVEQTLEAVQLEENEAIEQKAKFEYKEMFSKEKAHYYGCIRQWGREIRNEHIGPVRFLPGIKYRLTHKSQQKCELLIGLGLYRADEQVYLKIQHLFPKNEVKSYLYYAPGLRFPRRPQKEGIDLIYSKKEWNIECLGIAQDNELQEVPVSVLPNYIFEKFRKRETDKQQPQKQTISSNDLQQQQQWSSVQVRKIFTAQVETCLEQWEMLSQALPDNQQLNLIRSPERIVISNQHGEILLEYNTKSQILKTQSVYALLTCLQNITLAVTSSTLVTLKQQTVASRWLAKLQAAPLGNKTQLLAYLFDL